MRNIVMVLTMLLSTLMALGQDDSHGVIDAGRVDCSAGVPNETIGARIYILNDEVLAGLTLPLIYEPGVLTLDSGPLTLDLHSAALCELDISDIQLVSGNVGIVDVNLLNRLPVSGMELLMKYDPSVLTLLSASSAGTMVEGWEQYIKNIDKVSGLIRLDARPDLPGHDAIPALAVGDGSVTKLNFHAAADLGFMGPFIRIDFVFLDTLSNLDNTLLSFEGEVVGWDLIDYAGGSVFIEQFEELIGDINLNGVPFEVGDVLYFTNYFIDRTNYPLDGERWPNSDINQDNRSGTIGDLMLMRSIVGAGGGSKSAVGNHIDDIGVFVEARHLSSGAGVSVGCGVPIGGALFVMSAGGSTEIEVELVDPRLDAGLHWTVCAEQARIPVLAANRRGMATSGNDIVALKHSEDLTLTLDEAYFADSYGMLLDARFNGSVDLPKAFNLAQNYPNPFNSSTTIDRSLPDSGYVSLNVFNIIGQLVGVLIDGLIPAGHYDMTWDGRDESRKEVASGLYLYRLDAANFKQTKKMNLMK